jgi:hypothetical protein
MCRAGMFTKKGETNSCIRRRRSEEFVVDEATANEHVTPLVKSPGEGPLGYKHVTPPE